MAARQEEQQNGKPEKDTGHLDVRKNILMNDALYEYILNTNVYPREPQPLKELRAIAEAHEWSVYSSPPDEVQFMAMLLKLMNAKRTIEIGVFAGYSLLATALALPDDGKIIALDIKREYYELGLPIIEKAGVAHKIDFREGPALPVLDQLVQDEKNHGTFDFMFIDADKENYLNYHERALKLVKVGGLIAHDNTLWFGTIVAPPEQTYAKSITFNREHVWKINKALAADSRVEVSLLSLGDGVTLCRRLI